jgi:hypothetical protein
MMREGNRLDRARLHYTEPESHYFTAPNAGGTVDRQASDASGPDRPIFHLSPLPLAHGSSCDGL